MIAMDLRGHGDSSNVGPYDLATMAGDVGAVLAAEGAAEGALLVGHSLGGAVVSAYASGGPCRGVVNVDQSLALSGFQAALRQLEPMLRGDDAEFRGAVSAIFDSMVGKLDGSERRRVESLRDPKPEVVLGVWELIFTASPDQLDAVVDEVARSIKVPYLSLHGADPGPGYEAWLTGVIPTAVVEVWPEFGHYPHLVEPDRFVRRLVEFDA